MAAMRARAARPRLVRELPRSGSSGVLSSGHSPWLLVSVVMGVLMTVFFLGYTRVQLNTKPIKGGHALLLRFPPPVSVLRDAPSVPVDARDATIDATKTDTADEAVPTKEDPAPAEDAGVDAAPADHEADKAEEASPEPDQVVSETVSDPAPKPDGPASGAGATGAREKDAVDGEEEAVDAEVAGDHAEDPAEGEHAEGEASALETAETAAGATKPAAKATTQQVVDEEEVAQEGRESAVGDGDQGAANDQANEGENDPEQRHDAEEEGPAADTHLESVPEAQGDAEHEGAEHEGTEHEQTEGTGEDTRTDAADEHGAGEVAEDVEEHEGETTEQKP
mmetsp:Transcript_7801/g.14755  ORF Transcript_7801/g.14755 Transcript_7801/m.14755 type:complete len:337 (+) Transcript_7801:92-1102(+)